MLKQNAAPKRKYQYRSPINRQMEGKVVARVEGEDYHTTTLCSGTWGEEIVGVRTAMSWLE